MQESPYAPCPKCQAKRVGTGVKAGYPLLLTRLGSYGMRRRDQSTVQGIVCISCGYTELYAESPNNLIPKVD